MFSFFSVLSPFTNLIQNPKLQTLNPKTHSYALTVTAQRRATDQLDPQTVHGCLDRQGIEDLPGNGVLEARDDSSFRVQA